jgi:hypothetical protein
LEELGTNTGYKLGAHGSKTGRRREATIHCLYTEMLQWNPEDREDSEGVYWDEWLLADLIESGEVGWGN